MLSIEKAKREDARAAWEIRNTAILNQCAGHYSVDALKVWTGGMLTEDFIDHVEKHFYVAKYHHQVVGTGMINIDTGKIDAVFVHPNHMRKGIGRGIVTFLEEIALSHGLETLNLESTLNAAAFYRACGFKGDEIATYVSPRGISLDCIPMIKDISPNNRLQPTSAAEAGR
ncbi:GNAT family N-acetyltransferase [Methylocaldum gracile]|uniref:GNAT family N-acetyltransferase n=1 Tax=Methylocaldum sp. 0917 TaxID=2485163 RepID=UPI00105F7A79